MKLSRIRLKKSERCHLRRVGVCALSEDLDRHRHPPGLIEVSAVSMDPRRSFTKAMKTPVELGLGLV